jgi:hypothetical protein
MIASVVLGAGFTHGARAQSSGGDEMRRVFDQILQDPSNPGLNTRYARMAADRGEYRKAIAAYERILARDPTNAEAKAAIAELLRQTDPPYTNITLVVGSLWESNPRHERTVNRRSYDFSFLGRATVSDERRIAGMRWRTEADASYLYYLNFKDIELGTVGARTGPVFDIADGYRIHPFAGIAYTALERRTFNTEPTAGFTIESDKTGPLKTLTVRWGYNFVGRTFSDRDGTFVEVYPNFEFSNVVFDGSLAAFTPYWRYNGVFGSGAPTEDNRNQPFPTRQHQFGARADYYLPLTDWLVAGVNFTYEYRHFFERIPLETANRRDHVYAPGAQLIFGPFFENRVDVIGSYLFEYRHSNDGLNIYKNHTAALRLIVRM